MSEKKFGGERPQKPAQRVMRIVSHHITWWIGRTFKEAVPLVFVTGYPKSGTTWLTQMTADYLQLPFPRYLILPVAFPAVMHGHKTVSPRDPHGIYLVRDGRDALVSLFFHLHRDISDGDNPTMPRRHRRIFPGLKNKAEVGKNLTAFIKREMRHATASPCNWYTHVMSFYRAPRADWAVVRYEDLLADGFTTFSRAMEVLTGAPVDEARARAALDKFTFSKQAGRKAGDERQGKFLRKGQAGDWRNHFTREMAETFQKHCGEALVAAGYEPDGSWVQQCPETYEEVVARRTEQAPPPPTPIPTPPTRVSA